MFENGDSGALRTDKELIDATLKGELEAFDELMRRYERLVYKVAISFVRDSESGFDVTQTVFLKAFRALEGFRSEANVKTWLLRITYNESVNWLRGGGARSERQEPIEDAAEELSVDPRQERDLIARENEARIEKAMSRLNDRYRLAVALRYFQGLGIAEISQVLGCSEGVTRNILFRSVRSLRESLAESA